MEQLGSIAARSGLQPQNESQITQKSSGNISPRQNSGISREKIAAMLDVLKARWQTRGWHAMAKEDSEPMALEFIKVMNRHEIPYQQYRELYDRSVDLRARRVEQGLSCDDFSADMMVACWPSLKQDLHERQVAAGRTLTASAQSQCLRCFGTGMETVTDAEGRKSVRPGCQHEMLDETERTTAGLDDAISEVKLRQGATTESAAMICNRIRLELAKDYATAEDQEVGDQAWRASQTMAHAERYCRENL